VAVNKICPVRGCVKQQLSRIPMCPKHWAMVPLKTQAAICENHAPNQEALQVKSRAYSEGVRSAIDHVEAAEKGIQK
jgi:hypothetical protein